MHVRSIGGTTGSTCTFRRCGSGAILSSKDAHWRRHRAATCLSAKNRRPTPRELRELRRRRPKHPTTVAIFLTGSTGYIGAHVLANLLENSAEKTNLLVRARDDGEARERLWRAIQIHVDFPRFRDALDSRITFFRGDLTGAKF